MPAPITTFFMMFFVMPILAAVEMIFPGTLENVFAPIVLDTATAIGPYFMALFENETLMGIVTEVMNFFTTPFGWFLDLGVALGIFV